MTNTEILKLAKQSYTKCLARDFREQMKPIEPWMTAWLIDFYNQATKKEREECAQLCDEYQHRDKSMQPAECAMAIRDMRLM